MIYLFWLKEWKLKKLKTLRNKKIYVHIRKVKQTLNHGLVLKKVHRVIYINQKVWLKPYIKKCWKNAEKVQNLISKEILFKPINNLVFGSTM